jgi:DDE_Tnp_1-associated/Transposase DDE domain
MPEEHAMRRPLPPFEGPAPPGSLAAALAAVPDPRQPYGWRSDYPPIPLVALLQVAIAAMLCGSTSLNAIAQWVRERVEDDPALLTALGLPPGRAPCVATFHRIFKALDVAAFEQAVGQWLAATGVAPTDALAVDGKAVRGVGRPGVPGVYLVGVYAHAAETVVAQLRTEGKGHELAAARQVLTQTPIADRVVTGDALLTQRDLCTQIVRDGGDYLLPVDENQPSLRADLEAAFSPLAGDRPRWLGRTGGPVVADG